MSNRTIEIVIVGGKHHVNLTGAKNPIHKAGSHAAAMITVNRHMNQDPSLVFVSDGHVLNTSGEKVAEVVNMFPIEKRFEFLELAVEDVAEGDQNALVVVGPGGMGKTWTVTDTLKKLGKTSYDDLVAEKAKEASNASTEEELAAVDLTDPAFGVKKLGTYMMVKGHSSPKALYRLMWENHDGLLVFDDCDSIQKDQSAMNILKAGLDTMGERIISWRNESPIDDGLPQSFKFSGKIIFLSNLPLASWDGAVKSRSQTINVHMTRPEIIARMHQIVHGGSFMPEIEMERKERVLELMNEHKDQIPDLNLRTLIKCVRAYKDESREDFCVYMMLN